MRVTDNDGNPMFGVQPIIEAESPNLMSLLGGDKQDWWYKSLDIEWFHNQGIYGKGITIGVADTGIDLDHPDLEGSVKESSNHTDSPRGVDDVNGHGSHCAGIIGARLNDIGYTGVAPKSDLLIAKVLGDSGWGQSNWLSVGIMWLAARKPRIASFSFGSEFNDPAIGSSINYLREQGTIVFVAAGNDGQRGSPPSYPGAKDNVIAVAATDRNNRLAAFSTRGAYVDIGAPGVSITAPYKNGQYATQSGTSMATPIAAGCTALILEWCQVNKFKEPNQDELMMIVERTSIDVLPPGRDTGTGWGIFQPRKICEWIKANWQPIGENPNPKPGPAPKPVEWIEIDVPPGKTKLKVAFA